MSHIMNEFVTNVYKVEVRNYTRNTAVGLPNAVRCYINSPETIMLQLRGEKRYTSTNLTPKQAKELAAALIAFAECFKDES